MWMRVTVRVLEGAIVRERNKISLGNPNHTLGSKHLYCDCEDS